MAKAWPGLDEAVARAADDPRDARAEVLRAAGTLETAALPEFLEHAARVFAASSLPEDAAFLFGRARDVEDAHARLLGLPADPARAQRTLTGLVPSGAITASVLHDHLRRLATHPEPETAHRWAREAVCAFLDTGTIPYPNFVADLLPVARAAGLDAAAEERFVAERLLRDGLLPRAPLPVWEALDGALRGLAADDGLLDLLIAGRPDPALYDDPEPRTAHHRHWLRLLGLAGAGRRLSREWFRDAGPLPADELMRLASTAGDRLFPPPGRWFDPAADPVVGRARAHPLTPAKPKRNGFNDEAPSWRAGTDFAGIAATIEDEPDERRKLDAFVRNLGYYDNIDYAAVLRALLEHGPIRRVLADQFAEWRNECAAGDLDGLEPALLRLVPMAETMPDADLLAGLEITDPLDAAWRALRTGLPEELRFPSAGNGSATAVLHGELLTLGLGGERVVVLGPGGVVHERDLAFPTGAHPWSDGTDMYLSRLYDRRPETYRVADGGRLEVPDGARPRWPQSPASVPVTFPGAAEPVQVTLDRGVLRLLADGRTTMRRRFPFGQANGVVMPPPGFWPHLEPADPGGSAALRRLDRAGFARLVDAALVTGRELDDELVRVLPDVADVRLRDAVRALADRAAAALRRSLRLHDALGLARPAGTPGRIASVSGLRAGRQVAQIPPVRYVAELLAEAAGSGPAYDTPHPLGRVDTPRPNYLWFGTLGGEALLAARPWTPEHQRAKARDRLGALGDTPWGDGGGRWRRLWFQAKATQDPVGQVWRTPNGAMMILSFQNHPHKDSVAIEYSPDGEFRDFVFPGWTNKHDPRPQGWGGADRIARFLRLLDERGPAPYDVAAIHRLAERTGLRPHTAASAAYGFPFTLGRESESALLPPEVDALYRDPGTGDLLKHESWQLDDALREVLMPDEPEALWIDGLAVDKAVEWWEREGARIDWPRAA
ncbi:hypothetical protein [Actinomadura algeriensis]|uniref:Uncharacterized protein n=1 Tax=Actinomadura algeriensis TaxID=1679523 RepID=A0ABR9JVA8_9ACTN|nr:hypothetical protein [Actinomadura algeriensis]MBE1534512.1 hypothetical protein [Actinomadura algeriensis]